MVALWLLVGCWGGERYTAEISDARGLSEGAGVFVSGVQVGRLSAPRIRGDRVQIDLQIDRSCFRGIDFMLHSC